MHPRNSATGVSRRRFLRTVSAAAPSISALPLLSGAVQREPLGRLPSTQAGPGGVPASGGNPNILLIIVDQFRFPTWLNQSQMNLLETTVLPNIFGRIKNRSVSFTNYYVAATVCTPSRATLMTGLYSPQTCMYGTSAYALLPDLNPAFPTWAGALAELNPAYSENVWWFGKWHLTKFQAGKANPLAPYGLRTRSFPSGDYPSPDGCVNEGANGGLFRFKNGSTTYMASDAEIAGDFVAWLAALTRSPWCATVSLVNPHDICAYPGWFPPYPFPPPNLPPQPVYYPPPAPPPARYVYADAPKPWNYETPAQLQAKKIGSQVSLQQYCNRQYGMVSNWPQCLNWYFWLQHFVDAQVKAVLDALESSPFAANTVVIFTSDHGDHCGSHGLRSKGAGAYDEVIRVPLYVRLPGASAGSTRAQMCSSVDMFGLICDLGTAGAGQWVSRYPDLAGRESIYRFLDNPNEPEHSRIAPGLNTPYILHTCDEGADVVKNHMICVRTRSDPGAGYNGGKYAFYSRWARCSTVPDPAVAPDYEFYDYTNPATQNFPEMGNDYLNPDSQTAARIAQFQKALGTCTPKPSGLIGTELNAPLTGLGTDGQPLTVAQRAARQAFLESLFGRGVCPA